MLATYERTIERLSKILDRISLKAASGTFIIVEGKKDVAALMKLGVRGNMITVKCSGKVLEDCLDQSLSREVVILVDFDDHGTELAKHIMKYLESRKIKSDLAVWRGIRALVRKDVKDVEGLPSYLESLKKRVEV